MLNVDMAVISATNALLVSQRLTTQGCVGLCLLLPKPITVHSDDTFVLQSLAQITQSLGDGPAYQYSPEANTLVVHWLLPSNYGLYGSQAYPPVTVKKGANE